MLCQAAHHASHPRSPFHPFFSEICARRGYKMAVTAVAHRLARIIHAMLKTETDFDPEKLPVEVGPFTKSRVVLYRRKKAAAAKTSLKRELSMNS
jgi:hypothetical protein